MEHSGHGLVERRIAEAIQRGEFDNLPGRGSPIEGLTGYDPPDWWAKRWLERQGRSEDKLEAVAEVNRSVMKAWLLPDVGSVGQRVTEINAYIDRVNLTLPEHDRLPNVDLAETVRVWRAMWRARKPLV